MVFLRTALALFLAVQAVHALRPPAAGLLYTGQSGPKEPYRVTGFPGCAPAGSEVVAILADGSDGARTTAGDDGAFVLSVPYDLGKAGISLRVTGVGANSDAVALRLDYPLIGYHGDKGVVWFSRAGSDPKKKVDEQRSWTRDYVQRVARLETWAQEQGLSLIAARRSSAVPDSLQLPTGPPPGDHTEATPGEGVFVSGYGTQGDTATVILGASGHSWTVPVERDGWFSVLIPPEALTGSHDDIPTFVINLTDQSNQLLNSHGANPGLSSWVRSRDVEQDMADLLGHEAPDFVLPVLGVDQPVRLKQFRGQRVLLVAWATWCSPCIRELPVLEALRAEFASRNTVLLTVNVGQPELEVQTFIAREGLTLPVLLDQEGVLREKYNVYGIPRAMLVDADGTVVWTEAGYLSQERIRQVIQ